jgi:hypothetical protein
MSSSVVMSGMVSKTERHSVWQKEAFGRRDGVPLAYAGLRFHSAILQAIK